MMMRPLSLSLSFSPSSSLLYSASNTLRPPTRMSTSTEKKPTTAVDQDTPLPIPNLVLPQLAFILNEPKAESRRDGVLDKLLAGIEKDGMSPPSLLSSPSSTH